MLHQDAGIMAKIKIMVLSLRAAGLSLARGLKNTLKGGCAGDGAPAAAVVWGRHGFVALAGPIERHSQ